MLLQKATLKAWLNPPIKTIQESTELPDVMEIFNLDPYMTWPGRALYGPIPVKTETLGEL